MTLASLKLLYDYSYWTRDRVLAMAAKVTPEQLGAPADNGWGSLRGTLVHMLDAEYGWRMLCQQGVLTPDLEEASFPTVQAIAERWRAEETAMRAYLASLKDSDLTGTVSYTTPKGEPRSRTLWHCLFHIVNHSTHHRGQCVMMLRVLEHSPGDTDFTVFLNSLTAASSIKA